MGDFIPSINGVNIGNIDSISAQAQPDGGQHGIINKHAYCQPIPHLNSAHLLNWDLSS
jgi:hypothetical protein